MSKTEWERYAFDPAKTGSKLDTVRHVAHIPIARRIAEDERVRAGLINDKSQLNSSRISVSWTSANYWVWGSIYGTVEFQFAWNDLVAGKNIYWVEAMADYKITAYRFLLSEKSVKSPAAHAYDPTTDNGPLKRVGNDWFWNNDNLTSEFMIAEDLPLVRTIGLDFITHNKDYCSTHGSSCEDRRKQPQPYRTAGKFLAYILGHRIRVLDAHFKKTNELGRWPLLDLAYSGLVLAMGNAGFGGVLKSSVSCEAVVRGALALYGMDQSNDSHSLRALIASNVEFGGTLASIVREHFELPTWQPES